MQPKISAQDYFDHGNMHLQAGRHVDALMAFQAAVMQKPDFAGAWFQRGMMLYTIGNCFDAILNYGQALAIEQNPRYYANRGVAWADLQHYASALADYETALKIDPNLVITYQNRASLHQLCGRIQEAFNDFAKGLELEPNNIGCQLGKSMMQLALGDLVEGFKGFESRWHCGQIPQRGLNVPSWDGEDLNGKTIMIYHEQGHGDTIHFIRYATEIKRKYTKSTIKAEVRWPLVRLIKTVPGVDEVVPYGEDHGHIDYGCAVISCARVMGTTMETIPAPRQYIRADQHLVQKWRKDLDADLSSIPHTARVGICWAGGRRPFQPLANSIDARRSTQLAQWAPLQDVPGVVFVSLQAEEDIAKQIQTQKPPQMTILWPGRGGQHEPFEDFADTVALIENLDLVISVDTAVMHVAAALGKPTWMLSRFDGCWRWFGDRPDSPWYPTLRQFRQPEQGDWASVFKRVANELRAFVAGDAMKEAAE